MEPRSWWPVGAAAIALATGALLGANGSLALSGEDRGSGGGAGSANVSQNAGGSLASGSSDISASSAQEPAELAAFARQHGVVLRSFDESWLHQVQQPFQGCPPTEDPSRFCATTVLHGPQDHVTLVDHRALILWYFGNSCCLQGTLEHQPAAARLFGNSYRVLSFDDWRLPTRADVLTFFRHLNASHLHAFALFKRLGVRVPAVFIVTGDRCSEAGTPGYITYNIDTQKRRCRPLSSEVAINEDVALIRTLGPV